MRRAGVYPANVQRDRTARPGIDVGQELRRRVRASLPELLAPIVGRWKDDLRGRTYWPEGIDSRLAVAGAKASCFGRRTIRDPGASVLVVLAGQKAEVRASPDRMWLGYPEQVVVDGRYQQGNRPACRSISRPERFVERTESWSGTK